MRFARNAEQRQLAASLNDLLTGADVPAAARAWAAGSPDRGLELLARLAKIGVTELVSDASPVELVITFEELGRHAVPGPVVESFAVAPALLAEPPPLATVALPPHVPYALDADVATPYVVVGDTIHTGRIGPRLSSVDATRRLFEVRAGEPLGPAAPVFDLGVLCVAAQLLGLGRGLLAQASAYAKQRKQFGRPVGGFQALKHRLADVLVALEFASPLVYGAAVTGTERDVSAARVATADAAYRAARAALQVHGAIGYTAEHDLGLWLTKVRALRSAWGTQAWHRDRILAALTSRPSR